MKPHRPSIFADAVPVDGRGHRTPQTLLLIDERDRYLVKAAQFFPGAKDREAARLIRAALLRYQTGRWRRERTEALCPPHHAGKLSAVLWCLLKVKDAIPGDRLVRAVLSRSS